MEQELWRISDDERIGLILEANLYSLDSVRPSLFGYRSNVTPEMLRICIYTL